MAANPRTWADYTFAVVCAMLKERIAVEAMLDDRHGMLSNRGVDDNSYTFGSIGPHNVVITSLGPGNQGNAAAASVAAMLKEIRYCLLVGIAGGIPRGTEADIRLGDIVVGAPHRRGDPAVVEFQAGWHGEQFKIVQPRSRPPDALVKCIDGLEARYVREGPTYLQHLAHMLDDQTYSNPHSPSLDYSMPNTSDLLYTSEHPARKDNCDSCLQAMRPPRYRSGKMPFEAPFIIKHINGYYDHPVVHFGTIASSEAVVKSATSRQQIHNMILAQFGAHALCLEMEAAGVLRSRQDCLVIRGICDYADSHKNKQWQNFAAAAAASWMKDFLLHFAPATVEVGAATMNSAQDSSTAQKRKRAHSDDQPFGTAVPTTMASVLVSDPNDRNPQILQELLSILRYPNMNMRRNNIDDPIPGTCQWIVEHIDYRNWSYTADHQFLWILGHPGAGKSTIMKYLDEVVDSAKISFYFNGRGTEHEKTTNGMFRSFLYQLLQIMPSGWARASKIIRESTSYTGLEFEYTNKGLMRLIKSVVPVVDQSLHIFVDALDECSDAEVQVMIDFLEDLVRSRSGIKVCFASRYYPAVTVRDAIELRLDAQHTDDLAKYIRARLGHLDVGLQQKLIQKASGIFIWAVLVAGLLENEIRIGNNHNINLVIASLPQELDLLYAEIVARSSYESDHPHFQACMQWLLFSDEDMQVTTLYKAISLTAALLQDKPLVSLLDYNPFNHTEDAVAAKYVTNVSRGLAEIAYGDVQVIHESVRDFFLLQGGLKSLFPGVQVDLKCWSHEYLKRTCYEYLALHRARSTMPAASTMPSWDLDDPWDYDDFTRIAGLRLLDYALAAHPAVAQDEFFRTMDISYAREAWQRACRENGLTTTEKAYLQYLCHDLDSHPELACVYACMARFCFEALDQIVLPLFSLRKVQLSIPLPTLVIMLDLGSGILKSLLRNGADTDSKDPNGHTFVWCLITKYSTPSQTEWLGIILNEGASISLTISELVSVLLSADEEAASFIAQHVEVARILPPQVSSEMTDQIGSLLMIRQHRKLVPDDLIRHPDLVDVSDDQGRTALMLVCETTAPMVFGTLSSAEEAVGCLLASGADVSICDGDGWTALMYAVNFHPWSGRPYEGMSIIVGKLLAAGADAAQGTPSGHTAFSVAKEWGREKWLARLIRENERSLEEDEYESEDSEGSEGSAL